MALTPDIIATKIRVDDAQANRALDRHAGKAQRTANTVSGAGARMQGAFLRLGVAVGAAAIAVNKFDQAIRRGEEVSGVARGFDTLTASVGSSADAMLNRLRPAALGVVSDMELMRQANNAIILGLPVTTESMGELVEMSVKLGRALGQDATSSIESMITGIGRQSRMMLDNLGIVVDTQRAYADYAAKLGVATEQLTDQDRKMAFYEATLEAARAKTEELEVQTGGLGMAWQRATTHLKNFIDNGLKKLAEWQPPDWLMKILFGPVGAAGVGGLFVTPAGGGAGGGAAGADPEAAFLQYLMGGEPTGGTALSSLGFDATGGVGPPGDPDEWDRHLAQQRALAELNAIHVDQYTDLGEVLEEIADIQARLVESGGEWNATMKVASSESVNAAIALRDLRLEQAATIAVINNLGGAFLNMARAGEFSSRTLAIAVIRTLVEIGQAYAKENFIIGKTEVSKAAAEGAAGNYGRAAAHAAAAVIAFAGEAAILAVSGGGGARGGGVAGYTGGGAGLGAGFGATAPAGLGGLQGTPPPSEVRIFIEGQGFVQDFDAFADELGDSLQRRFRRTGQSTSSTD